MARHHNPLAAPTDRRKSSAQTDQGKRPRGVSKVKAQRPLRRSARLNLERSENIEQQYFFPAKKTARKDLTPLQPKDRKRSREIENPLDDVPTAPLPKRPRPSSTDVTVKRPTSREASICDIAAPINPIDYWRNEQAWPKEYFEPDTMGHLLARKKKSMPSLRRKRSDSASLATSSNTPSDQKQREEKSAQYKDVRYETLLATKGSFMDPFEQGIIDPSRAHCRTLLEKEQAVPQNSLFRDDLFESTCRKMRNRNETRVIRDISLLIVPSAETLATYGAKHLEILIESTNEGWNNSIPLTGTRPQPDYSVGFKREAFTAEQLNKLSPFIGDWSFFMATYYMYFPFLMCEVKCGAAVLDVADRQNAHSMTLATRAIVELFRLVKREKELHRQILSFSISHDHRSVRIYGHYPVINGSQTTFYRHPIRAFDFTELDGKEKWTAYRFTKNVYDTWMPTHWDKICSAIDDLPSDFDFEVPLLAEGSGLSQDMESHHVSRSFTEPESLPGDRGGRSGIVDAGTLTPDTSFTGQGASKRLRNAAK
ncbi:hypothetical protein BU26DRAFT_208347 [Trematosphaeria pertusa]|uniref:DUF7924 domain-containing protein n=1 Tax=Trematosphaeria pertusa TaxID=390896 RepID=A0A6A6HRV2_9PLEO|nr:uncharacterized protein BU26DRAFT_208347 [Trematosphaeria pertusa]KAF2240552.1 hypothetical protein BU26DRAFT_208347 [Trematosphaeria pertusa]